MAYREARDAVNLADMAETQYVAQAALADAGDVEGARKSFQLAFLRAPLFTPSLVSRAYEILTYDKSEERFVNALNLFELALRIEPENTNALAGRLVTFMHLKRYNSAQPLLDKLLRLEPNAPDIFVLQATNLDRAPDRHTHSLEALARARKLDPANYKDTHLPQLTDLMLRMTRLRRVIPLTPALLDRADMPNPSSGVEGKTAAK